MGRLAKALLANINRISNEEYQYGGENSLAEIENVSSLLLQVTSMPSLELAVEKYLI